MVCEVHKYWYSGREFDKFFLDLFSFGFVLFSSSLICFFSLGVMSFSLASFLAFLTDSDLLMMVSRSSLSLLNPSIFIMVSRALGSDSSLASVALSTLTRRALSRRLARRVALVQLATISRMPTASTSLILLPSYAKTGKNLMKFSTLFSRLFSSGLSLEL